LDDNIVSGLGVDRVLIPAIRVFMIRMMATMMMVIVIGIERKGMSIQTPESMISYWKLPGSAASRGSKIISNNRVVFMAMLLYMFGSSGLFIILFDFIEDNWVMSHRD
jgi:magnesium-transporting ATPase (P-type)